MALFVVAALRTVRAVAVKRVETLVSSFNDCLEGRPSREPRLARGRARLAQDHVGHAVTGKDFSWLGASRNPVCLSSLPQP